MIDVFLDAEKFKQFYKLERSFLITIFELTLFTSVYKLYFNECRTISKNM